MKKVILVALVFMTLLGLVSIPLLYPLAKIVRSQQHFANALAFHEAGEHKMAFFKLLSARNLTPDKPEILALLGPYGAAVNDHNALRMWTEAADAGLLDKESRLEMVEYGLRTGRPDDVRRTLFQLAREDPDNARVQALQLRFLRWDRQDEASRSLAQDLIRQGNRELDIFSIYLQSTFGDLQVPETERAEALSLLREVSGADSDVGIYSLRFLLRLWGQLEDADKGELEARLQAHPQAALGDRLALLSLKRRDGAPEADILVDARVVYGQFRDAETPEDGLAPLTVLVEWLNREGFHETVLEFLPDPEAITDPAAYFTRQIALIATGQAARARDLTFKENPLSLAQNLVCRALAQMSLGEPDKASLSLSQAVESVQFQETVWLEQVLRRSGEVDLIIGMYESLEKRLSNPLPAQLRLLPYYYGLRREHDIMRVVDSVDLDRLSGSLAEQFAILYFLNLYRGDRVELRRHLERLVSIYPDLIEPRVFLAFCYSLTGQGELARPLIEGWDAFQMEQNRSFAIMLATIFISGGDPAQARELIGPIPPDTLLHQERVLLSSLIP
jgi:hypothetical protein